MLFPVAPTRSPFGGRKPDPSPLTSRSGCTRAIPEQASESGPQRRQGCLKQVKKEGEANAYQYRR